MKSVTNFSQVTNVIGHSGCWRVNLVADRLQEVGLAEADAAVDEQRVPARRGRVGDHARRRVGELVGRADDELVERVARHQVGRRRHRRRADADSWLGTVDRAGTVARRDGVAPSRTSKSTVNTRWARASRSLQDRREEVVLEPLLVVAVRRPQADAPVVDADALDRPQPQVAVRGLDHRFDGTDRFGPELKHPTPTCPQPQPVHAKMIM